MARHPKTSIDQSSGWETHLKRGAMELGLVLSSDQAISFRRYAGLLQKWGGRINLTSRMEPHEIISIHFLDSLSLLSIQPPEEKASLVDIGAGAGFPGIPLKILRPDLSLTLIEASGRKVQFLKTVIDHLSLDGVSVIESRVEAMANNQQLPMLYDWAVVRAVATLSSLLGLAAGLLREGGVLAAYKGAEEDPGQDMLKQHAVSWRYQGKSVIAIPGREQARSLLFFQRVSGDAGLKHSRHS